jgi:hypothetical protein
MLLGSCMVCIPAQEVGFQEESLASILKIAHLIYLVVESLLCNEWSLAGSNQRPKDLPTPKNSSMYFLQIFFFFGVSGV